MSISNQLEMYHSILGVGVGAGLDEIRRAYRAKARQLHPDVGGSSDQMQQLNEAYEILTDLAARKAHPQELRSDDPIQSSPLRHVKSDAAGWPVYSVPYEVRWLITRSVCSVVLGLICFANSGDQFPVPVFWGIGVLAAVFLVEGAGMLYTAHRLNRLGSSVSLSNAHIATHRLIFRLSLFALLVLILASDF